MKANEYKPLLTNQRRNTRLSFAHSIGRWLLVPIIVIVILSLLSWTWRNDDVQVLESYRGLTKEKQTASTFQLRHIYHQNTKDFNANQHGRLDITADFIKVHGLDSDISINEHEQVWTTRYQNQSPWIVNLPIKSNIIKMKRLANRDPAFVDSYLEFARLNPVLSQEISLEWDDDLVDAPNVTDKETIISLALMSSNAYVGIPQTGDWRDVNFNSSFSHGWNGTGVRGHVFVSDDNSTVVIAYKGTSAAYLTGSGDDATVVEDKENDNLLFSCCCARISYIWTTVCDCYKSSYTCDQSCLEKELYRKDKYFHAALNVYKNVSAQYPDSNIWLTGHSLGGALSSLVGRTYGLPAVGFESPGDLLATKRLHLPMPPGLPEYMEGIWHFGHTADPIFMGVCNGASSSCSVAGYAMETQCHSGRQCIYDVVTDKGWHVNMLNHRIHTVIDDIIEVYNETARCVDAPPCSDCFNWRFVSDDDGYKDKKPDRTRTTSVVETPAPTNAPKCIKKTWYGRCLEYEDDEI